MAARKAAGKKKSQSAKKAAKKAPARKRAGGRRGQSPRRSSTAFRIVTRLLAVISLVVGFWAAGWVLDQDQIVGRQTR